MNLIDTIPEGTITKDELVRIFDGQLVDKPLTLNGFPYKYHKDGFFSSTATTPATDILHNPLYPGLLGMRYLDAGAEVKKEGNTVTFYTSESVHCKPITITYTHEERTHHRRGNLPH